MALINVWSKKTSTILKLWHFFLPFRFIVVGAWNFGFSYIFFVGMYWWLHDKIPETVVMIIVSVGSITNSFIFHRIFTYRSQGAIVKEYFRFYLVYGVQTLLNIGFFFVLVQIFCLNAYLTQAALAIVLTAISYWGHKHVSFGINKGS